MNAAELMRIGAGRIREKGLARGMACDEEGKVCAIGSMMPTPGIVPQREACPEWADAVDFLNERVMAEGHVCNCNYLGHAGIPIGITGWNDQVAKDGEEVAQFLEKSAAAWEEANGA